MSQISINRKIGYARVSTKEQNLDLQLDALKAAGCTVFYEEVGSGKSAASRPQLMECMKALRPGDTLVVWRLDRLGRSLTDLVSLVGRVQKEGAAFESLTERIETASATGKLMFHVFASLAEFERSLMLERTEAGMSAARARGRPGGRRPKLTPAEIKEVQELMKIRTTSAQTVAKRFKISRATVYKYCNLESGVSQN